MIGIITLIRGLNMARTTILILEFSKKLRTLGQLRHRSVASMNNKLRNNNVNKTFLPYLCPYPYKSLMKMNDLVIYNEILFNNIPF